jgi:hypothetical protein
LSYRNRNKFINQIRAPGGHIQITIMIDTQQQYIKINIRGEISIIVVQAHSGKLHLKLILLLSYANIFLFFTFFVGAGERINCLHYQHIDFTNIS